MTVTVKIELLYCNLPFTLVWRLSVKIDLLSVTSVKPDIGGRTPRAVSSRSVWDNNGDVSHKQCSISDLVTSEQYFHHWSVPFELTIIMLALENVNASEWCKLYVITCCCVPSKLLQSVRQPSYTSFVEELCSWNNLPVLAKFENILPGPHTFRWVKVKVQWFQFHG